MNYTMKELTTKNGKFIHIYDDLFSYQERFDFYYFMMNSKFSIMGYDTPFSPTNIQLFSIFDLKDLSNFKFCDTKAYHMLNEKYQLENRGVKQIRVNSINIFDNCTVHHDKVGITLLYYANIEWDMCWSGHTIFPEENLTDIEHICAFIPGRLVMFDGSLPHLVTTPNIQAKSHRLTFVIQFE